MSHLTPTISRLRLEMLAGSFGSTVAADAFAFVGPVVVAAVVFAEPIVAATTAMTATPAVARRILFIQQLLLRW